MLLVDRNMCCFTLLNGTWSPYLCGTHVCNTHLLYIVLCPGKFVYYTDYTYRMSYILLLSRVTDAVPSLRQRVRTNLQNIHHTLICISTLYTHSFVLMLIQVASAAFSAPRVPQTRSSKSCLMFPDIPTCYTTYIPG